MFSDQITILTGDCRDILPKLEPESIQCVVTSPPYWGLRDYGIDGQIGLEKTPEEYVDKMVGVFREVRRVLKDDGTVWLNLGDSYASNPASGGEKSEKLRGPQNATPDRPKDLVGIPWRVAFALQADGWYLRSDIIWAKPNPMPESVTDRPTKAHEYIFLLTKSERYFYDQEAIKEPCLWSESWSASDTHTAVAQGGRHGNTSIFKQRWEDKTGSRNKRTVWTIPTHSYPEAHFATFPEALVIPCVKAGSREGDTVLDPFGGSGTVGKVCQRLGRKAILIDLNPEYCKLAEKRTAQGCLL